MYWVLFLYDRVKTERNYLLKYIYYMLHLSFGSRKIHLFLPAGNNGLTIRQEINFSRQYFGIKKLSLFVGRN